MLRETVQDCPSGFSSRSCRFVDLSILDCHPALVENSRRLFTTFSNLWDSVHRRRSSVHLTSLIDFTVLHLVQLEQHNFFLSLNHFTFNYLSDYLSTWPLCNLISNFELRAMSRPSTWSAPGMVMIVSCHFHAIRPNLVPGSASSASRPPFWN